MCVPHCPYPSTAAAVAGATTHAVIWHCPAGVSKLAEHAYCKALAPGLQQRRIMINTCCPGWVGLPGWLVGWLRQQARARTMLRRL